MYGNITLHPINMYNSYMPTKNKSKKEIFYYCSCHFNYRDYDLQMRLLCGCNINLISLNLNFTGKDIISSTYNFEIRVFVDF